MRNIKINAIHSP